MNQKSILALCAEIDYKDDLFKLSFYFISLLTKPMMIAALPPWLGTKVVATNW
jgi:hypothetical protein